MVIVGDRLASALRAFLWTGLNMGEISRQLHGKLKVWCQLALATV